MGGKHKAQRTKNNVRPSSSGRSAELLGTNVSSFVGFSAIKDGGYVPVLPGFSGDEIDSNINPNFHLVLKKMNKKDSTTKLKALNEFGALCRDSDPAAVKTVLPFWPRLYCVLATDTEHRVREAAHNAHKAVVSSVGKNIAPYLKQIAGAWFTSQYDTYPPAASAASSSFQEAFSPNKLTEAIIFCQQEILNYITDNLVNQTPQTLSNPKTTTIEEMEAKYQRVIVSSLHGYGFYLSKLPQEQLLKAEEINKKLIENSKFWKFSKHSANIVRVAWFSAVVNLCQRAPFFLSNVKKQVVTAVFNSLDDSDSVVLPIIWEASLHLIVTIKDWWEHVSVEKLVFPKLWKILKEGGLGCASSIFPNLLPFLSKIPPNLIPDKQMFYLRFFSSLEDGIKQRNVQSSVIESEAVAECYIECLGYIVLLHVEQVEFCNRLISEQLLPVIELTLKEQNLLLFRRPFYNKLISLLVQWTNPQKSQTHDVYTKLVSDILRECGVICCKIIDCCTFDKKQMNSILGAQADLISAFKYHQAHQQKKRLKVTFSEEKSPNSKKSCKMSVENFFEKAPASFQFEVNTFVKKMIEKYFYSISAIDSCKGNFVGQLSKVLTVFNSHDIFNHLLALNGIDKSWNEFYSKYLSSWLVDEQVLVEDVSQLIFVLLKYVENEDEKQFVLHSLSQTETKKVLEWCLKNENINFSSVKHWLSSDKMDSIILSVVEEAITIGHTEADNAYQLVKLCLKRTNEESILMKYETVISILKYLSKNLQNYKNSLHIQIDCVAGLIYASLSVIKDNFDERYEQDFIAVVSECFEFGLNRKSSELDRTWQDFVLNVVPLKNTNTTDISFLEKLVLRCSASVEKYLMENSNLTINELCYLVGHCGKLLNSLEKNKVCCDVDKYVHLFLNNSTLKNENQLHVGNLLKFCYCIEVIHGNLSFPSLEETLGEKTFTCDFREILSGDMVNQFVLQSLFGVLLLFKIADLDEGFYTSESISVNKIITDQDIDVGSSDIKLVNVELNNYTTYLADFILNVVISQIFKKNFSKTKQFFECCDKLNILEKCTRELIHVLDQDGTKNVERDLIQRGGIGGVVGGICAEAVYLLHSDILGTENLRTVLLEIIEENKLCYSQPDLPTWLHQVFSVGTGFNLEGDDNDNLILLSNHLRKQNSMEDLLPASHKFIVTSHLDRIFKLGKLVTFETDLLSCSAKDNQSSGDIAQLLSIVVDNYSSVIDSLNGWDFTMIAAASWICNLKKITSSPLDADHFCSLPILHLLCSVCHLFKSISNHVASLEDGSKLKAEWNDVFRSDVQKTLVNIWVDIATNCSDGITHPALHIIFNELAIIIEEIIDVSVFITTKSELPYWLNRCCSLLQISVADVQFTAFKLLMNFTPHLVASDSECDEKNTNKGDSVDVSFKHIENSLKHLQTIVDTMLSGFKLGDTCIVEPFTDGYVYTRGYFFLWLFILEICDKADSQLRFMYTAWIKENHFLEYLMKSLFCVMPEEAVHGHEGNVKYVQELFLNPPEFSLGFWRSKTLAHLSAWTYYKLLGRLPAEVRQWWSEIDHKEATIVERLTATYVSPLLCTNELKAVRQEGKKFQNMTVRVHPAAREVIAVYTVEESSTELVIQLPLNHPLGPTKVESGKCMVSTNQTRQWIMQLSLFLTHQNGSIWDALSLWKTQIDKKFEGVEECYICFSILHNVSQQLPRLSCQTCKKKFHNTCLYQWFTTSNKSTCPICRNLF